MAVNVDDTIFDKATTFSIDIHGNLKLHSDTAVVAVVASGTWKIVEVL